MTILKIGDVVEFKEDDISMTVEKIDKNTISCVWFIKSTLMRATFDINDLKKIN